MGVRSIAWIFAVLAGSSSLIGEIQASGRKMCKPTLVFKQVRFSEMQPPTLKRKWTAVLSVDASRCKTNSGRFGIIFVRLIEGAPEIAFQEQFVWRPASVTVSVDFAADEAVDRWWLSEIAACPCRK
jgi:hypothetical protein